MTLVFPPAFHVMAKPAGALCNQNCEYCFFLKKAKLYPGSSFRMSDAVMESYIRQTIEAHRVPSITVAWQGGEPTLMGLDFFKRSIEVQKKYLTPGKVVENTLQTNGILIDEAWCVFLRENRFLVGLSLDGPKRMHDAYRHDRNGRSVFDKVIRAARLMQEHQVEFNILCTVNAFNSRYPLEVYRFFRDELQARYIQFIPIVERENDSGQKEGARITDRSVQPGQYGRFLNRIFDEWVQRDVGTMFVQLFDGVLASWVRGYSSLCIFRPQCGDGVALEHNGDLYSCDHFVEPDHLLGNILKTPLQSLVVSDKQKWFGQSKSATLPRYCKECEFLFTCHGECPKNRVLSTPDGEPGLNWLCAGLKAFFKHTERYMRIMTDLLRRGQDAAGIMQFDSGNKSERHFRQAQPGRNSPCPCGSGLKFKRCHGNFNSHKQEA